ncbi:MAG: LptF/LptG family permease [Deltaproteobacteria bacterium]|jgi:lipopolysaccharide export system permease protein|nr:LptF/LptG family permease [Deltaproteobacteria bacterium]
MTILNRYLVRSNLFLLTIILLLGSTIYILTDFFLRIDVFFNAGLGAQTILLYFLFKLPFIIAQILPPVFLLSMVLQLSMMTRHREILALQAGGISFVSMIKFVFIYGVAWICLQFAFAQILGVEGNRRANAIWLTEAQGKNPASFELDDLWFNKNQYVIHLKKAWPNQDKASGVVIYELDAQKTRLIRKIYADSVNSGDQDWQLKKVSIALLETYSVIEQSDYSLPVNHSLVSFNTLDRKNKTITEMNIFELSDYIDNMKNSGTNVEAMRTDFHNRFAYAVSLFIMGIAALSITMHVQNIYASLLLSITITFFYYGISTFFTTLGEKGQLDPLTASWFTNFVFFAAFGCVLLISILRGISHRKRFA